ncbi:hypothetical protein VKT23_020063 [Stygiomarasmius scandens]|uniref:WD40 repeat-like protein n=1 Tax=Marasmiellus scandens TaxID=2682957 RepID=A0ABR1IJV3_9AGAR
MFSFSRLWRKDPYKLVSILQGPRDAVLSVSFSVEGRFVAAAGYSGVYTWDLSTGNPATTPYSAVHSNDPRRMFSASSWLLSEPGSRNILILGSMRGELLIWEWRSDHEMFESFCPAPALQSQEHITSISVHELRISDQNDGRIVVATADSHVAVLCLSVSDRRLDTIFNVSMAEGFIPKSVCFHQKSRDVIVFAMTGGVVCRLNHATGEGKTDPCDERADMLGSVCVDEPNDRFIAWTGQDFDIFTLSTLKHVRTLKGFNPLVAFPKQTLFIDQSKFAIAGTDRGCAVIYDTGSGVVVNTLRYPKDGLVHTVAYCTTTERDFLGIAGSTAHQQNDVVVYSKKHVTSPLSRRNDTASARILEFKDNNLRINFNALMKKFSVFAWLSRIIIHVLAAMGLYLCLWLYTPLPQILQEYAPSSYEQLPLVVVFDGYLIANRRDQCLIKQV